MKSIDFYYDYGSPTAYLAWTQLSKLDSNKYQINYKPVLLGGIFAATSNRSPIHVDAKAKWMWRDLQKYARTYNVVLNHNDAFPVNTLYLMRGAIYAKKNNAIEKYNEIMFKAMWMSNINLSESDKPSLYLNVFLSSEIKKISKIPFHWSFEMLDTFIKSPTT